VQNFQDRYKLTRDGIVGPATWNVLIENVKAVQRLLNSRGYNSGYVDGWFGPITTSAVRAFQRDNGLYQEGIVNPRTRQRLFNPYPKDNFEDRQSSNVISSLNPYRTFKSFVDLPHFQYTFRLGIIQWYYFCPA